MSFLAYLISYNGERTVVFSRDLSAADQGLRYTCISCGANLHLRGFAGEKRPHFFGEHFPNCNIGSFTKKNTLIIKEGVVVDLCWFTDFIDAPLGTPVEPPILPPHPGDHLPHDEDEDQDFVILRGFNTPRSAKGLYDAIWELPAGTPVNASGTIKVEDIAIHPESYGLFGRDDYDDGLVRVVKCLRVNTANIHPSVKKKGYIVLRLEGTSYDSPIFLRVKLAERSHHQKFLTEVAGSPEERNKNRFIVVVGRFRVVADALYAILEVVGNSKCVDFVSR